MRATLGTQMNAERPRMNAVTPKSELDATAGHIVSAAYRVSTTLGAGFLEKVYENALVLELRNRGLRVEQQKGVTVRYEGEIVGEYVADLLVEDELIVELKSLPALDRIHRMQCLNYLRASNLRLALLINFGRPRLEVARIAFHL